MLLRLPVIVIIIYLLVSLATLTVVAQPTKIFRILPDDHHSSTLVPQCQAAGCYSLTALLKSTILSDSTGTSNVNVLLHPGIHSINNSAANEVFSISDTTTFALTAVNSSEGATIKCTRNTGFAFSYCAKLIISGITFDSCGAHFENTKLNVGYRTVTSSFVLLIFYSTSVQLSDIRVKNGSGIGLLAVNVRGSFDLSDSEFINNTCNLHYFSNDRGGVNSNGTVVVRVTNLIVVQTSLHT